MVFIDRERVQVPLAVPVGPGSAGRGAARQVAATRGRVSKWGFSSGNPQNLWNKAVTDRASQGRAEREGAGEELCQFEQSS